jgi:hypothetical protein
MTDTPRTNNAALHGDGTTVPADFAADLERELNAAKAEVERLREALRGLEKEFRNTYPVYLYDEPWGHETNVPLQKAQAALKETK